jgi:uncharacterized membrane protein SirB2
LNVYITSYYLHVSCVVLSGSFFALRGIWMLCDSDLLQHRIIRILPHIIDTLLLASAISLTLQIRQFPITNDWLTVKLVALVAYVLLGIFALRKGKTKFHRFVYFISALLTYGFIVSVALTNRPVGIFG